MSLDELKAKQAEYGQAAKIHQQKLGQMLDQRECLANQVQGLDGDIALIRKTLYQNQGAAEAVSVQIQSIEAAELKAEEPAPDSKDNTPRQETP